MKKYVMEVEVVEEAGYESSMRGLALNMKQNKDMKPVADKLCSKDGGHNKFLESMIVWVEVNAPRYWWSEADTYRLTSKQSESTMHTIIKDLDGDFNNLFEDGSISRDLYENMKDIINSLDGSERLVAIKKMLPEGFLQKRMWRLDYKTLRNIIQQRKNHRLPHWKMFIEQILEQVEHPEFLT